MGTSVLLGFGLESSWDATISPRADRPWEKVMLEERGLPGLLLGSEGELRVGIPPLGPLPTHPHPRPRVGSGRVRGKTQAEGPKTA